jgi:glycosyltransferase involved in cell wall biosynthesis
MIKPHRIAPIQKMRVTDKFDMCTIGILGDIGIQKGAKVLNQLSSVLLNDDDPKIVVIGRVDPQYGLGRRCVETGSYTRAEIASLAEKHGITTWLIPSIWPETFSYTTHEALETGLPVFSFDLGAQGEAVSKADNGHLLPLAWSDDPRKMLKHIRKVLAHGATRQRSHPTAESSRNRSSAA